MLRELWMKGNAAPVAVSSLRRYGVKIMSQDTGWKKLHNVVGNEEYARGEHKLDVVVEQKPCFMCKRFENDQVRTRQHLAAHGLYENAEGKIVSPIAKDFNNRAANMEIDPNNFGWCRLHCQITDMQHTCEEWKLRTDAADMKGIIR